MKILISETDGESTEIAVVGDMTAEAVLEQHGYDPTNTDWSVDDPQADLANSIQNASNLQELKDALTDSSHPVQARGNGR